jgi:hypothetical protein
MKPAYYDFEFIRGTTKNLVVRFDVDLSSHTATFSYINDSGVKVHVPLTVSLHQASPVIYQVSKEFTPAETRALPSRSSNINYELQVKNNGGAEQVWLTGNMKISGGINPD